MEELRTKVKLYDVHNPPGDYFGDIEFIKVKTIQDNSCIYHSLLTCIFPHYQENPGDRTKIMHGFRKSLLSYLRAPDTNKVPEMVYESYKKDMSEIGANVNMYDAANVRKDITDAKVIANTTFRDAFNWSKSRKELYSGNSRMFTLNRPLLIRGIIGRMREVAYRESPDEDIKNMRLDKIERNILNADNICDNSVKTIIENVLDINILIFTIKNKKTTSTSFKDSFKENKPMILIFNTGSNIFEAGGIKKGKYVQTIIYPNNAEYPRIKTYYYDMCKISKYKDF